MRVPTAMEARDSFPIPTNRSKSKQYEGSDFKYKDLVFDEYKSYLDIMRELGYKYDEDSTCHLDPDIYQGVIKRTGNWKGAFGQVGAAQAHLDNALDGASPAHSCVRAHQRARFRDHG